MTVLTDGNLWFDDLAASGAGTGTGTTTRLINIVPVNDTPALGGAGSTLTFTEGLDLASDTYIEWGDGLVVDEGTPAYLFGPDSNERVQAFLSKIL